MNYENSNPTPERRRDFDARGFDVCAGAGTINSSQWQQDSAALRAASHVTGGLSGSAMPSGDACGAKPIEESELEKVLAYARFAAEDLERLDLIADRVFGAEPPGREWVVSVSGGTLDRVKALVMNLQRHAAAVRTRFEFPHLG